MRRSALVLGGIGLWLLGACVGIALAQPDRPPEGARPQEYYERTLTGHSKTFFFAERTVRSGRETGRSLMGTFSAPLSLFGSLFWRSSVDRQLRSLGMDLGSSSMSPLTTFFLIGTLADSFSMYQMTKGNIQKYRSSVELVYWDAHLLDAHLLLYAQRELTNDLRPLAEYRQALAAQFPVEDFVIFQVRVFNQSPANVQYQPFTWHLYLEDGQGHRVKMVKYDPQLDGMIRPGQQVEGYVYFSRRDLEGSQRLIFPPGEPVRVVLEEFAGEHGTMEFE